MRSILTVTAAASVTRLTTLSTVLAELGLSQDVNDVLARAIDQASAAIGTALGRALPRETVSETFRPDSCDTPEALLLNRWPVASITSVTVDGTLVAASEYEIDRATGLLYRLDASGYRSVWTAAKAIVVVYIAGYVLPESASRDLPHDIERACIVLVSGFWAARGRDPRVRVEDIPGVMRREYWVVAGDEGANLAPDVLALIAPYRRIEA